MNVQVVEIDTRFEFLVQTPSVFGEGKENTTQGFLRRLSLKACLWGQFKIQISYYAEEVYCRSGSEGLGSYASLYPKYFS